ncbi:TonB family protein [Oceanicaulis sp. LC35]|uniref:energy transducer TonB n=1 Tax=Oceanicaulis sp. LC35 TaxID=3349635 RepID=UPI003F82DBFC
MGVVRLVLISVGIHAGILWGWLVSRPAEPAVVEAASLSVSLGSSGASSGAVQSEPEAPSEPEIAPEPSEPDPVPQTVRPEPVARVRPPLPDPEPEEPATEHSEASPTSLAGAQSLSGNDEPSDQVDTDGDTDQAGYEQAIRSHDGEVLARFIAAKRYPPRARMQGREGVVGVEFTLDASGRVLRVRILDGSSHDALDRAVLEQVERATPFPPRPDRLNWTTRTYRTEVRFSLQER